MEHLISVGMLPPEPTQGTVPAGMLQGGPCFTVVGGKLEPISFSRPAFPQDTIQAIPVRPGQSRCHFISYKVIAQSIATIVNQALEHNVSMYDPLTRLLDGIYFRNYAPESMYILAKEAINAMSLLALNLDTKALQKFCQYATELLGALNGAIGNLRPGNQNWNASIGYQFDPEEWFYAVSATEYFDNAGVMHTITPGILQENTFYLRETDRERLSSIADLAQDLPTVGVFSAYCKTAERPFLYSSNNGFLMPSPRECEARGYNVEFTSYPL